VTDSTKKDDVTRTARTIVCSHFSHFASCFSVCVSVPRNTELVAAQPIVGVSASSPPVGARYPPLTAPSTTDRQVQEQLQRDKLNELIGLFGQRIGQLENVIGSRVVVPTTTTTFSPTGEGSDSMIARLRGVEQGVREMEMKVMRASSAAPSSLRAISPSTVVAEFPTWWCSLSTPLELAHLTFASASSVALDLPAAIPADAAWVQIELVWRCGNEPLNSWIHLQLWTEVNGVQHMQHKHLYSHPNQAIVTGDGSWWLPVGTAAHERRLYIRSDKALDQKNVHGASIWATAYRRASSDLPSRTTAAEDSRIVLLEEKVRELAVAASKPGECRWQFRTGVGTSAYCSQ
jgi:hypothetical protein